MHVLVQAVLSGREGRRRGRVDHDLPLTLFDGRWEISAIDAALYQSEDDTPSGAPLLSAIPVP